MVSQLMDLFFIGWIFMTQTCAIWFHKIFDKGFWNRSYSYLYFLCSFLRHLFFDINWHVDGTGLQPYPKLSVW